MQLDATRRGHASLASMPAWRAAGPAAPHSPALLPTPNVFEGACWLPLPRKEVWAIAHRVCMMPAAEEKQASRQQGESKQPSSTLTAVVHLQQHACDLASQVGLHTKMRACRA